MKRLKFKIAILTIAIAGLVFTSCSNDSETVLEDPISEAAIDLKTAENEAKVDQISDETSAIIEDAVLEDEYVESQTKSQNQNTHRHQYRYLPDCVTITKVIVQNMKTVTLDFGEGCELRNGNVVSGKIIMIHEIDPEAATKTITYSFENFFFNDKSVEGGGTIFRERSNENGNPQSTKTFDVTVTWPDGLFVNKKGEKTREWIEGFGTPGWGDNVFLITGEWTFTKRDGTVVSAKIIKELRRELACKFIVSGIVELSRNGNTAILDYGDGECDDLATVSINGGDEIEIHLSNKK